MATPSEELMPLVNAARQGERTALDAVVRAVLPDLRAYVRLHVGDRLRQLESCSDMVQTACRGLVEDIGGFRGEDASSFRRWLFTLALNKIQMHGRHWVAQRRDAGRLQPLQPAADSLAPEVVAAYGTICTPSRHAVAREEMERIERAFDHLPDEHRTVLTLACILGLPHREIAAEMGKSEVAVRKLLSRARARLALVLAQEQA
ncbi:MAG: sigma-70 family RNA polymerase sigma factor [Planctomycetes bacterium]|nr:sigma-70 family RNA polymerase sigma factor [Planctomycetota bacterium]